MSTVAHYVSHWLDISAGFVADQVEHSRERCVVISRDGWLHLDAFPHQPRHRLHLNNAPGRIGTATRDAQLISLLTLRRAQLVHVHFGAPANDLVRVAGRRWPYVLTLYGHDVTGLLAERPDHYTEVAKVVDAVIVLSKCFRDIAIRVGFDPERIVVIPIGVDTSFFTPTPLPDGPPVVGYVGRLVEKKGIDVLLRAWPRIRAEVPDATLSVLGAGPLEPQLKDTDDSVSHVKPDSSQRREQVREVMRRASVVVTPSRTSPGGDTESLLLVNLEAGACGRPVVSTYHGGIPEYVQDGSTGLLVPENDSDALAAAVIRVLRDRALAQRLADTAASHVAQWDVRKTAARVDDLHAEVLASR